MDALSTFETMMVMMGYGGIAGLVFALFFDILKFK